MSKGSLVDRARYASPGLESAGPDCRGIERRPAENISYGSLDGRLLSICPPGARRLPNAFQSRLAKKPVHFSIAKQFRLAPRLCAHKGAEGSEQRLKSPSAIPSGAAVLFASSSSCSTVKDSKRLLSLLALLVKSRI